MKRNAFVLASTALATLLTGAKPAVAQASSVAVTWNSMPVAVLERGDIACPGGGTPSDSLFPPWCPPDSRTTIRTRVQRCVIFNTSDARISGTMTEVLNANLDAAFSGPVWGTSRIEVPGRGSWEGNAEGEIHGPSSLSARGVLHGSGEFEGMKLKAEMIFVAGQGATWVGHILDPGGQK